MKKHKINNLELRVSEGFNSKFKYLEIVEWSNDFDHCWTIITYKYDEDCDCYELNSCGDRLNDNRIDWYDLGCLVKLGYTWLKDKDLFSINKEEDNE
jgi:hypothetical protein